MSAGYCSINVQLSSHANTIIIHQPPHNSIKHLSASQQTLVHIQPPAGYHPYTCGHFNNQTKELTRISISRVWCLLQIELVLIGRGISVAKIAISGLKYAK